MKNILERYGRTDRRMADDILSIGLTALCVASRDKIARNRVKDIFNTVILPRFMLLLNWIVVISQ